MRPYVGRFQYPGKDVFWAGTVMLHTETPSHEIEKAVRAEFLKLWNRLLPDSYDHPALIGIETGSIFFAPEDGFN